MRNRSSLTKALVLGAVVIGAFLVERQVRASNTANANADVTQTVIRSITLAKTRDLDFGEAAQDTAAKIVLPADGTSAQFTVGGEGAKLYDITLPGPITLLRTGGTGGVADDEIVVNAFSSTPNGSGVLSGVAGAAGSQTLNVGATRAALTVTQNPGAYTGSFSVTVVYQ